MDRDPQDGRSAKIQLHDDPPRQVRDSAAADMPAGRGDILSDTDLLERRHRIGLERDPGAERGQLFPTFENLHLAACSSESHRRRQPTDSPADDENRGRTHQPTEPRLFSELAKKSMGTEVVSVVPLA